MRQAMLVSRLQETGAKRLVNGEARIDNQPSKGVQASIHPLVFFVSLGFLVFKSAPWGRRRIGHVVQGARARQA